MSPDSSRLLWWLWQMDALRQDPAKQLEQRAIQSLAEQETEEVRLSHEQDARVLPVRWARKCGASLSCTLSPDWLSNLVVGRIPRARSSRMSGSP